MAHMTLGTTWQSITHLSYRLVRGIICFFFFFFLDWTFCFSSEAGRVADAVEERVAAMESGGHPVSQADIALHLQRTRSFSNGGLEIDSRIVELETALRKEREQKVINK